MNFPTLTFNRYAVLKAEFATGHVLNNNNSIFFEGDDIMSAFTVFNSFEEAEKFCRNVVQEFPDIECCMYDYLKQPVFIWDRNGERKI